MKTDVQDISETRKVITVTVTPEEVSEEETALVKTFQQKAKLPGFRPGKAPENMIRSRYAKELKQELAQRVVSKAHREGVAASDLQLYGIVALDEGAIEPGSEARISFTVDIIPDFELPPYEGLEIETESDEASDEEIDKMIQQLLSQRAEFNVAEKAAETGDYVRCSYEGTIEGTPITEIAPDASMYGTQAMTWEEAGAAEDTPGVRAVIDGLVGMKAGDEKEVTMEFPSDFEPEVLAGKTATYAIKAEEVREKVLPEMNEAFFEGLQVKDEAELRERVKENIENQKRQSNANAERQQITDRLLAAVDFPLPESGVESETEVVLRDFMQRNMQQGVSSEELEKNKEQLYDGATGAARNRLKSRFVLSKIAEKENITVENEDLSRRVMQEAMQTGQKPEKLVKELRKDQERIAQMRRDLLLGKTMDHLLEKARRQPSEDASDEAAAKAAAADGEACEDKSAS